MRERIRMWACVVSVALLGCSAGCQKDQPERSEAATDPGASRPQLRGNKARAGTSIPVDSWPADTTAIVAIDLAQFRRSPIGALVDNLLRTTVTATASCGSDVIESASEAVIVSVHSETANPIFVLGGVSRDKLAGCAEHPSVWLGDRTFAFAPGWKQSDLEAATSSTNNRTNPRVLASMSHVDTSAALWFAAARPDDAKEWTEEFSEMRGVVVLDGALRASFELKYPDAERATTAAAEFERALDNLEPFSKYLEDARAHTDGEWMQARIIISEHQLKLLRGDPLFSGLFPPPEPDVAIAR